MCACVMVNGFVCCECICYVCIVYSASLITSLVTSLLDLTPLVAQAVLTVFQSLKESVFALDAVASPQHASALHILSAFIKEKLEARVQGFALGVCMCVCAFIKLEARVQGFALGVCMCVYVCVYALAMCACLCVLFTFCCSF
jgi:hypothetical protein